MLDRCPISDRTYCYCNLSQDVLLDGFAFLDDCLVEFIQRRIHQLHADPNVSLENKTKKNVTWVGFLVISLCLQSLDRDGFNRVTEL